MDIIHSGDTMRRGRIFNLSFCCPNLNWLLFLSFVDGRIVIEMDSIPQLAIRLLVPEDPTLQIPARCAVVETSAGFEHDKQISTASAKGVSKALEPSHGP